MDIELGVRICTGFNWSSGRPLGTRQWTFGFHTRRKVSWKSEQLSASEVSY